MEMIPSPQLGFLRGVFLANHLASNDNLTRTTKRQNTYQLSLSLSVLKAIFQVNLGQPVFIEAKDDGGGGNKWTTGAISRAKLQSNHNHQQTNIQFF